MSSEELVDSALLYGLKAPIGDAKSGPEVIDLSSSDSGAFTFSGSVAIQKLATALDTCCSLCSFDQKPSSGASSRNTASSATSSGMSTSTSQSPYVAVAVALRRSLCNLLFVEIDATKTYSRAAFPYIIRLGQRIDRTLSSQLDLARVLTLIPSLLNQGPRPVSAKGVKTKAVELSLNDADLKVLRDVVASLEFWHDKMARGLYRMPPDGEMVPTVLRKAEMAMGIKLQRLEVDGVEEIAPSQAHGGGEGEGARQRKGTKRKRPIDDVSSGESSLSSWPEDEEEEEDDEYDER